MSDPTQNEPQTPAQLREYAERMAARAEEAEARLTEAQSLQRENAFLKAGVALDSPVGKLFSTAYSGELDVDKVSAAWAEVAPAAPTPTAEPPAAEPGAPAAPPAEPTAEELAVAQARAALSQGTVGPGEEPQVPAGEAMLGAYNDARARGRPVIDAQRAGLQEMMNRAVAGDETALFQKPGEAPAAALERWRQRFE